MAFVVSLDDCLFQKKLTTFYYHMSTNVPTLIVSGSVASMLLGPYGKIYKKNGL